MLPSAAVSIPPGNAPGLGSRTSETAPVTGLTSPSALPVNWSLQIFPSRSYFTSQEKLAGMGNGAYSVIGPAPPVCADAGLNVSVNKIRLLVRRIVGVSDMH